MSNMNENSPLTSSGSEARTPAVSIVVPVYNREEFLERCLDSLVFQTCQDIEIIVVNDGSTDSSQEIIDRYHALFPHLIVPIVKENGGQSSARKRGMEEARGKYISYVDSDDWMHLSAIEIMLEHAGSGDQACDLVYARSASLHEGNKKVRPVGKSLKESADLRNDLVAYGNNAMWGKLWSKALLQEHAQFLDIWHEDCVDVPVLVSYAERIAYIDTPLYYYFKSTEVSITSVSHNTHRRELFLADEIAYRSLNPDCLDAWRIKIVTRLGWNLSFTDFYDEMVEYARRAYDDFELSKVQDKVEPAKWEILNEILAKGAPVMPKRLVLPAQHRDSYSESIVDQAFGADGELSWVDVDDTIARHPWLKQGVDAVGPDYAVLYAACESIYENGGFYFSPHTLVGEALNPLLFHTGVFAFESCRRISNAVVGGSSGSPAIKAIMDEYEADRAAGAYRATTEILTDALVFSYSVSLSGKRQETRGIVILGVEEFVFDSLEKRKLLFKNLAESAQRETASLIESMESALSLREAERKTLQSQINQSDAKITQLRRALIKQRKRAAQLEKQVKELTK